MRCVALKARVVDAMRRPQGPRHGCDASPSRPASWMRCVARKARVVDAMRRPQGPCHGCDASPARPVSWMQCVARKARVMDAMRRPQGCPCMPDNRLPEKGIAKVLFYCICEQYSPGSTTCGTCLPWWGGGGSISTAHGSGHRSVSFLSHTREIESLPRHHRGRLS